MWSVRPSDRAPRRAPTGGDDEHDEYEERDGRPDDEVNVLIGVVLNSLDEAREMEAEANRAAPPDGPAAADAGVRERIATARRALDALEADLAAADPHPAPRPLEPTHTGA
ncbi:hypothetical protein ACFWTC_09685 [Streptomyces sp. NPDC058619]|uniref:hypothetical protein n=1 Tax=unclassified Streptomyces TaxID=2593676 RepID=UPI003665DCDC